MVEASSNYTYTSSNYIQFFSEGLLRASLFRCRYLLLFLYRQAGVLNIMCVHMQTFIGFNLGFNCAYSVISLMEFSLGFSFTEMHTPYNTLYTPYNACKVICALL